MPRKDRDRNKFDDPWLESLFNTPEKKARLHIAVTVGYILFFILMVIGIGVVIIRGFGFF